MNAAAAAEAAQRVRSSFARQTVMSAFGATLARVEPGQVDIELAYQPQLCQQNGYLHAGISTTIADSAGGYAALTLYEPGEDVLTSEFKQNLLAPSDCERYVSCDRIVKPVWRPSIC